MDQIYYELDKGKTISYFPNENLEINKRQSYRSLNTDETCMQNRRTLDEIVSNAIGIKRDIFIIFRNICKLSITEDKEDVFDLMVMFDKVIANINLFGYQMEKLSHDIINFMNSYTFTKSESLKDDVKTIKSAISEFAKKFQSYYDDHLVKLQHTDDNMKDNISSASKNLSDVISQFDLVMKLLLITSNILVSNGFINITRHG